MRSQAPCSRSTRRWWEFDPRCTSASRPPVPASRSSSLTLQYDPVQDDERGGEIDHESRHVDERRDEWRRRTRGIEADTTEEERQHRSDHRPEGHDADECETNGDRDQMRFDRNAGVLIVIHPQRHAEDMERVVVQVLPQLDAYQANHAEDDPEREAGRELTHRDAPPVANADLLQSERADHQRR